MCVIGRVKRVAILESREIARVAYYGQIMNIERDHTEKLIKEISWEGRDISVREWVHENGSHLRIARNRMSSIFWPNNE